MAGEATVRNGFWFCRLKIEHWLTGIICVISAWAVACLATLFRMPAARVIHGLPVRRFLEAGGDILVTSLAGFCLRRCGGIGRRVGWLVLIGRSGRTGGLLRLLPAEYRLGSDNQSCKEEQDAPDALLESFVWSFHLPSQ